MLRGKMWIGCSVRAERSDWPVAQGRRELVLRAEKGAEQGGFCIRL